MREVLKESERRCPVPMEEPLGGTEDGTDAVGRDIAIVQFFEISGPELVLDEKRHFRLQRIQELFRVTPRGEGQVEDPVSQLVVLSRLISRRRKERNHDLYGLLALGSWLLAFQLFNNRSCLLELAY